MQQVAKDTSATLPRLFKKTSTGAIQSWEIRTDGNVIVTQHGQVDGKIQETSDTIKEGKNIGKKSETTPAQQAALEAQAKWEKQKKKGYVESYDDAVAGKIDEEVIEGGVSPMLAHKFSERAGKIIYPAYGQPKFDGIRCVAVCDDGKCTLWSRTRKPITGVPHIARAIESAFPTGRVVLDGELYNHDFKADFEKIVSFVRQQEPKEGHEVVQYHIYDVINDLNFEGRAHFLSENIPANHDLLKTVETVKVSNEDELIDYFQLCRNANFEGAMVRNADGFYENKRSNHLQKIKEFDDAEFEILGVGEGRGKLQGRAATFVCKTKDGKEFEAKMKGDTGMLKKYFEDHSLWKGKKLTVKYQGLTGANGVPRFPVGVTIRDYE